MKHSLGQVTSEPDGFQVKFERTLNYSIEKVWEAITDPKKLRYWFTDIDIDLRPGGKIGIRFRDGAKTLSYGEIILVEKPTRFVFTWETEKAVWELERLGEEKCKVKLTYSKLEEKFAASAPAGWHILFDRLEGMLGGSTVIHPFGTEDSDPAFVPIQEKYGDIVYKEFPQLLRYKPIVVEKTYDASVERVWQAITDKDKMKKWYFDLSDFRAEVGFEFSFPGQGHKGEKYIHICKVTEVVAMRKLSYSWAYQGLPGESTVSFELFPDGKGTRLKLTHRGLDSFPKDNADFAPSSFSGGWNELIGKSLDQFLSGQQ